MKVMQTAQVLKMNETDQILSEKLKIIADIALEYVPRVAQIPH